jgi:prepilin-type processing-associated H-X9-DG protein/prepilin-type N-terminal cleavage/methylation domain-containing protein
MVVKGLSVAMGWVQMRSSFSHSSFTLLELLVVIAMISVLAALMTPALANARAKARQVQCSSNLRQVGLAFHMYADEHGDYYPEAWDGSLRWQDKLLPYLSATNATAGKSVLICPSAQVDPVLDYNVYKKNQWPATNAEKYDSQVILAFDGTMDNTAAADSSDYSNYVTNRHAGSANYLFGDGHISSLTSTLQTNWVLR